jgi:CheY-like chemotaxis protein
MDAPRVMIVEDDPDLRAALEALLVARGYDVALASNGAEAIEQLAEGDPPATLIVDLLMPGVVGQELLEFVRDEPGLAHVRVAIVTGSPKLAPAGYAVFPKPLDLARLLAFLRADASVASVATAPGGSSSA